ncbi:hypothetical protein [Symbiopectobacterium sp. RP]|uniref:hypothetical protein n=1 Tax=Symbiopectobacterium sp. RP TaxID=3248553 RepID=UPI003D2A5FAE
MITASYTFLPHIRTSVVIIFKSVCYNVMLGNATKAAFGKDTHAAADLLRFIKQNAPSVNFMNLWGFVE